MKNAIIVVSRLIMSRQLLHYTLLTLFILLTKCLNTKQDAPEHKIWHQQGMVLPERSEKLLKFEILKIQFSC